MNLPRPFALALAALLAASGLAAPAPVPAPVPAGPKDTPKTELAKLAGVWKVVSYQRAGVERIQGGNNQQEMLIEFGVDGSFEWVAGATGSGAIVQIDPSKKLREIDYTYTFAPFIGKIQNAIYKLEGDTFTDCHGLPEEVRPTEFSSTAENGRYLVVYQRVKPVK